MKGLILKDLINLRRQGAIILVLLAFYAVIAVSSHDTSLLSGMIAVLAGLLPVTAISYDERAHWEKYALTMPVSRAQLVISKYLLGVIFCAVAFAVTLISDLLLNTYSLSDSVFLSLIFAGIGIVFMSLMLPVLFRFGVERGRFILFIILLAPTLLALLFSRGKISFSEEQLFSVLKYTALPGVLILFCLSILISLRIYRGKEF